MLIRSYYFLFMVLIQSFLFSETLSWNVGFYSRVGRGEQEGVPYDYLENYFTFRSQMGAWTLTGEWEYNNPPEYGFEHFGIRRMVLLYQGKRFSLDIGHLQSVFGNGLSLNLFEEKTLDFDNRPIGVKFQGDLSDSWQATVLIGRKSDFRFYSVASDLREPDVQEDFDVGGVLLNYLYANGNWTLSPYLVTTRLTSNIVYRRVDEITFSLKADTLKQHVSAIAPGLIMNAYGSFWDIILEISGVEKRYDRPLVRQEPQFFQNGVDLLTVNSQIQNRGRAIYAQWNWYPEWITLFFEYKQYRWGLETLDDKINYLRQANKALPFQVGPTGIRQHDIGLLANITHPVDYGDEVGINFEVKRIIEDHWLATLSITQISQTNNWLRETSDETWWPKLKPGYFPFEEYFIEFEYTGVNLNHRSAIAFTKYTETGSIENSRAENIQHFTFTPAYVSLNVLRKLVIGTTITFQRSLRYFSDLEGVKIGDSHSYFSNQVITSLDWMGQWSLACIWDSSDERGKENWVSGEISYRPTSSLWIRVSYGAEKGGVRCTGGVCRIINPFEGFRLTLEARV